MSRRQLQIEGLSVATQRNGKTVRLVDKLDLTLNRGEILALVGPSGSGKSLTCAASLGVLPPGTWQQTGRVLIDGVACDPAELRGREVATILQNPRSAFNPVTTMGNHARETLHAAGRNLSNWQAIAEAAMLAAGLPDAKRILRLHAFEMSGGMLQRMMIALALISDTPFLFADEPTTDLDLIFQRDILDLIDRLKIEREIGILLVTHDMSVVARLADKVAVIANGRLVEEGSVSQIFLRPVHQITRQLIAAHLALYDMEPVA